METAAGCKRANASTTKIMTCILALENGKEDDIVTVSAYAASMPNVQLNIEEGEQYYLKDLLYSLMLESHNDSAVAIAEHIGGSVEGFSALMNEKAKELGCSNTCFLTPNGLDASVGEDTHGTTAHDLALIMRYCSWQSPRAERFLEITQTNAYSFTSLTEQADGINWELEEIRKTLPELKPRTDLTPVQQSLTEMQKSLTEMNKLLERVGNLSEKYSCKWIRWLPDFSLLVALKWIALLLVIGAAAMAGWYGVAAIRGLFL